MNLPPTTGEDEVWGAQQYVGESLQEAKVHQVGEEANSNHQHWEAFKNVETCQHTCRELEKVAQTVVTSFGSSFTALNYYSLLNSLGYSP